MQKFQRNYKIVFEIGHLGDNLTDLIPEEIIEVAYPFTCRFKVSNTLNAQNCGKCQIQLLNLPEDVQKKLYKDNYNAKKYILMEFYAGYQNEMPLIFYGFVSQCYSYRDSGAVDFTTDIQADSNQLITIHGFNNVTIAKDTRFEDVIKILTEQFPWYKPRYITPKIKPLAKNKTFIGQTLDLLGREYGQYDIFIDNGEINILDKNEVVPGNILVINSDSGLLGSPRRAEQYLYFEMIFEPRLKLAQAIELQSSSLPWFNQLYKVYGIEHNGVISPVECGKVTTKVTLFLGDDVFESLREVSNIQAPKSTGEWQKPVNGGIITSNFGYRKAPTAGASTGHKGIDIGVQVGTPVYAAANGTATVLIEGGGYKGFGRYIQINHGKDSQGNNLTSLYGHLSQTVISSSQNVSKGQLIAYSGGARGTYGAGTSTGPHLHFQINKNGSAVNPTQYIGAWT
jgi:murein DD-endopeptidase MepM/ murein hydrolase activator NlpD